MASLLRRLAQRDAQAMASFYDQTVALLFSVAVKILGDRAEAEDVIQEVYLQIWDHASTFEPALGTPLHWAARITRNRSIDRLRARGRRQRVMDSLQNDPGSADLPTEAVASASLDGDAVALVRRSVAGLGAEQRQAIEMAFFGGLTHAEIAAALGQPLGTVKARIRRGMLALRESLQPKL